MRKVDSLLYHPARHLLQKFQFLPSKLFFVWLSVSLSSMTSTSSISDSSDVDFGSLKAIIKEWKHLLEQPEFRIFIRFCFWSWKAFASNYAKVLLLLLDVFESIHIEAFLQFSDWFEYIWSKREITNVHLCFLLTSTDSTEEKDPAAGLCSVLVPGIRASQNLS